ncbi:MAG: DUF3225 domain-containing protein [Bacteroidetes bacterium]|nr:DUF3225 domain-containing protein [Bacteroidota bacterium]
MELNLPAVHAEVSAAFARYEQALVHNEVEVLDALFWASPHTVRYGVGENLYGADEILAFRRARGSGRRPRQHDRRRLRRPRPSSGCARD